MAFHSVCRPPQHILRGVVLSSEMRRAALCSFSGKRLDLSRGLSCHFTRRVLVTHSSSAGLSKAEALGGEENLSYDRRGKAKGKAIAEGPFQELGLKEISDKVPHPCHLFFIKELIPESTMLLHDDWTRSRRVNTLFRETLVFKGCGLSLCSITVGILGSSFVPCNAVVPRIYLGFCIVSLIDSRPVPIASVTDRRNQASAARKPA
eukprot:1142571-Prorocentrum_minimum.AAC.2